jgi:hypothetical protein
MINLLDEYKNMDHIPLPNHSIHHALRFYLTKNPLSQNNYSFHHSLDLKIDLKELMNFEFYLKLANPANFLLHQYK